MRLSCATCRSNLWVEHDALVSQEGFACDRCGSEHDLEQGVLCDPGELNRRGLELAGEHELDLATANSVVLGLLSLEVALRRPQTDRSPAEGPAGAGAAAPAPDVPQEVRESRAPGGDPTLQAESLARRSGLPLRLAMRVVEGELTLHAAQMLKPKRPERVPAATETPAARPDNTRLWIGAVVVAVVLVVAGTSAFLLLRGPAPESTTEALPLETWAGQATVLRNDAGEPVQVSGPDPQSVLAAFCAAAPVEGQRVPSELQMVDRRAGLRLGVFRAVGDGDRRRAIRIERRGREWFAGDGRDPIEAGVAPEPGPSTVSIPLSSLRRDG